MMLLQRLRQETSLDRFFPNLISGLIFGTNELIYVLSFASLVFSGELKSYLPYGIGMALVTTITVMAVVSLTSRISGVIGSIQDTPSVILGVIAAGLARTIPAAREEERLITILTAITIATLLTGISYLVVGYFKLGRLMRFLPYTVVGGFLAGTGWLLVVGSFGAMNGLPLNLNNLPALLQAGQVALWAPGVLFAIVLFIGVRRIHHFLVLPGIVAGGVLLYYVALFVMGISVSEAIQRGLTLGEVTRETVWRLPSLPGLFAADWHAILGQSGNIAIVIILSLISLLLNASALEVAIHQDIQLDRELKAAGFANLLSGLAGGMIGYHTVSLSSLGYRMGARGRLPGIVAGAMCIVVFMAGGRLLAYFPKSILGGLLLFVGLDFLFEWVVAGWSRLSRSDYAVVLLILIVIGTTNYLVGVGVGLAAMILLFVMNYSRIDVVHHEYSGSEVRSAVERSAEQWRMLNEELGAYIRILELQGFIFFGTANELVEVIRARLADQNQPVVRYIILDFRRVAGLDTTAVLSFKKINQIVESNQVYLVLAHLSEKMRRRFELDGLCEDSEWVRIFSDLDHSLEWCENQLLSRNKGSARKIPDSLSAQLVESGFNRAYIQRLLQFLERVVAQAGETLIQQGEQADSLFFIEQGTVSVYSKQKNGEPLRLRTLGLGTSVGELGLYLRTERTASVIADTPAVTYRLTRQSIEAMTAKDPELAAVFHEYIAYLISKRLVASTHTLETALQ